MTFKLKGIKAYKLNKKKFTSKYNRIYGNTLF